MAKKITDKKAKIESAGFDSVGIIMDGNGRWAKKRLLPRTAGHVAGAANVQKVLEIFREMGVHHVTVYAF